MDLDNIVEIVVRHLLIRGMTYLVHRDGLPMVNALVYVMHTGYELK